VHKFISGNYLGITIRPCKDSIYSDSEHKLSLNQSIEELIKINPKIILGNIKDSEDRHQA